MSIRLFAATETQDAPRQFEYVLATGTRVRAPLDTALVGRHAAMASFEYRFLMFGFSIGPIGINTELAAFADVGVARPSLSNAKSLSEEPPVVAGGPALRLHFPSPVFTDFRFEYGFSSIGNQFFFTAERDF